MLCVDHADERRGFPKTTTINSSHFNEKENANGLMGVDIAEVSSSSKTSENKM